MAEYQSIDQLMLAANIAITNALNQPTLLSALSDYNLTPERIRVGELLYQTAMAAVQKQRVEYSEQLEATSEVDRLWEKAKSSYGLLLKIARIVFKNETGATVQLGLNGIRKQSLSGWIDQAQQFYGNGLAQAAILEKLGIYGITQAKVESGQADLQALITAKLAQEKEKGEAQQATQNRDGAIDALQEWLSDFIAVARLALADQPQLLETIGIRVES